MWQEVISPRKNSNTIILYAKKNSMVMLFMLSKKHLNIFYIIRMQNNKMPYSIIPCSTMPTAEPAQHQYCEVHILGFQRSNQGKPWDGGDCKVQKIIVLIQLHSHFQSQFYTNAN